MGNLTLAVVEVVATRVGCVSVGTVLGEFFFWTRFYNLVIFNSENYACANGIAKQRHVRGNSFATEDLGI